MTSLCCSVSSQVSVFISPAVTRIIAFAGFPIFEFTRNRSTQLAEPSTCEAFTMTPSQLGATVTSPAALRYLMLTCHGYSWHSHILKITIRMKSTVCHVPWANIIMIFVLSIVILFRIHWIILFQISKSSMNLFI